MSLLECPTCFGEGLVGKTRSKVCRICLGKGVILIKTKYEEVNTDYSDKVYTAGDVNVIKALVNKPVAESVEQVLEEAVVEADKPWYKKLFGLNSKEERNHMSEVESGEVVEEVVAPEGTDAPAAVEEVAAEEVAAEEPKGEQPV